ncbi:MAG: hypothetical protein J5J00_16075, partial [Deltaproteobacteria bacterium]|nr:hypothetical protein [Deltaproteobacteria bacterium]
MLLAAFLLFSVQPLISKLFLPLFGGTPMVWNICALFFQVLLLGGYFAAHLVQKLPPRREGFAYAFLLILSLGALPIGLPSGWSPEESGNFSLNLLFGLSITVGLPYFTVASASPTVQKWFSRTAQPSANDPYFLYALSNLGSLAALVAYPFAVEPYLTIADQLEIWSLGFVVFAAGMLVLRFLTEFTEVKHDSPQLALASSAWQERLQWVLLAFVPSSLSLGVTQHLTTDVAAIPLLWILPLALYLTSFIVAFARKMSSIVTLCRAAFPLGVALPAVLLANDLHHNITLQIAGHLFGLFVIATRAHSLLAEKRPPVRDLTE